MTQKDIERLAILEKILDHAKVSFTCVDSDGNILYVNPAAAKRPSKTPRTIGVNIKDCHKVLSNRKIDRIFDDFRNGRTEPHHYVSQAGGKKELVTIIPVFESGVFTACVSQIHPLEIEGPERSF